MDRLFNARYACTDLAKRMLLLKRRLLFGQVFSRRRDGGFQLIDLLLDALKAVDRSNLL